MSRALERMPVANLVVAIQKIAKNVSHFNPSYRQAILTEAAKRLTDYRQTERKGDR